MQEVAAAERLRSVSALRDRRIATDCQGLRREMKPREPDDMIDQWKNM